MEIKENRVRSANLGIFGAIWTMRCHVAEIYSDLPQEKQVERLATIYTKLRHWSEQTYTTTSEEFSLYTKQKVSIFFLCTYYELLILEMYIVFGFETRKTTLHVASIP